MAANLLVRRSTARLLCLVRSQIVSFVTERSPSSEPFITTGSPGLTLKASYPVATSMPADEANSPFNQYCKKYNLLKDTRSIDEILDDDKEWQNFYHPIERCKASADLWTYWHRLKYFGECLIVCLFKEYLVKHCSHGKIQMDEAFKFKEAFSLPLTYFVDGPAKHYYYSTVSQRYRKKLPKVYRVDLLEEVATEKKKLTERNIPYITDELMTEIEEDIKKKINEIIVNKKKRKGKERKGE